MSHSFCAFLASLLAVSACVEAGTRRGTLRLEVNDRQIEGTPLIWSDSNVSLLARDGKLWSFHPAEATNVRKTSSRFWAYSDSEIRGQLLRELGRTFEVTATGHYLVAHPRGQRDNWSDRFEQLYRSFVHYFTVRGFDLREPEFPLVAIVWKNRQGFLRYAQAEGTPLGQNVLGYYSPVTNRITLYDRGSGAARSRRWQDNNEIIIHEATHQTAFNTGVHTRFADTPTWVVEGLGTLFEATGVFDSRAHGSRGDRVNRDRFSKFQSLVAAGYKPGSVYDLVASDRFFDQSPLAAYAHAWALSFYLVETQPRRYSRYLALVAKRPAFAVYTPTDRLKDFTSIFGGNFRLLEAKFLRFMKTVR